MLKLTVYIPEPALDAVKRSLFEIGAGSYGQYDQCCWQVKGEGQFRPLPGSRPAIGTIGATETVSEYRLEILLPESLAQQAAAAIHRTHPYEEPAFDFTVLHEPAL